MTLKEIIYDIYETADHILLSKTESKYCHPLSQDQLKYKIQRWAALLAALEQESNDNT